MAAKKAKARSRPAKKRAPAKKAAKKAARKAPRRRKDGRPASLHPIGAPTKCTPQRIARFCEALRIPVSIKSACAIAGFTVQAQRNYVVRAEAALVALGLDPTEDLPPDPGLDDEGAELPDPGLAELLSQVPESERPFVQFFVASTRAHAAAEAELASIAKMGARVEAAQGRGGRTALGMLERRFPTDWGVTQKHEHTGKDGGAIEFFKFKIPEESD